MWEEAFPSLKICEVPTVYVVARTIIVAAYNHDVTQRRHHRVEITCLYMIILVSSVPMYGAFEGLLGHKERMLGCLYQVPVGNGVESIVP